jgi:hypothetical protein
MRIHKRKSLHTALLLVFCLLPVHIANTPLTNTLSELTNTSVIAGENNLDFIKSNQLLLNDVKHNVFTDIILAPNPFDTINKKQYNNSDIAQHIITAELNDYITETNPMAYDLYALPDSDPILTNPLFYLSHVDQITTFSTPVKNYITKTRVPNHIRPSFFVIGNLPSINEIMSNPIDDSSKDEKIFAESEFSMVSFDPNKDHTEVSSPNTAMVFLFFLLFFSFLKLVNIVINKY